MTHAPSTFIALFGIQGSGKGTQAQRLSALLRVPHISPGELFRQAVAEKTSLGKQVGALIVGGHLVPDDVTNNLMAATLGKSEMHSGFILDGYPRNEAQAQALDMMTTLTHAIVIEITDEESVRRLSQRRVCPGCGTSYHVESTPPVHDEKCDGCGRKLLQRDDDTPAAIRKRLAIYHTRTEPITRRYADRNILFRIDGMGGIDEVWDRIQQLFV